MSSGELFQPQAGTAVLTHLLHHTEASSAVVKT
jgi:hypothetical protein